MKRVKVDEVSENIKNMKITFERIPELTQEKQELLHAIKRGLKEIQGGKGIPIEEVFQELGTLALKKLNIRKLIYRNYLSN